MAGAAVQAGRGSSKLHLSGQKYHRNHDAFVCLFMASL